MVRIIESDEMVFDSLGEVDATAVDDMSVEQIFDIYDIVQLLIAAGVIPNEPYTIVTTEKRLRECLSRRNRPSRRW